MTKKQKKMQMAHSEGTLLLAKVTATTKHTLLDKVYDPPSLYSRTKEWLE